MSTALETDAEFAVVLLAQDGTIVDAHPTCLESLGWPREDIVGKDIGELLQSDRDLLMSQLQQSQDAEVVDGQTSFSVRILARRRDETSFPARVVVRRFDQTGCCTAAFYRVTPYNDTDSPPIVRPEEIELAMRGNNAAPAPAAPKPPEKPKFRWRNARLLFGSKSSPAPEPAPVQPPVRQESAPVPPAQKTLRNSPPLNPQIPENLFQRKDAAPAEPSPVAPTATAVPAEAETAGEQVETPVEEMQAVAVPQAVELSPAREPIVPFEEATEKEETGATIPAAIAAELEQEREERRRLEQRSAALTAQVSALHLQVSENLEIESRNQKKVTALEEQLRESRNQVTQLKSDLAHEREKANAVEQKVEAANAVSSGLTAEMEALKLVHEALARTQAECESQLKAVNDDLRQAQEALATETAKRQELELALAKAQQQRTETDRNSKLELSKLETVLKQKELELREAQTKSAQVNLQAKS
jgi:hypothetical protein